MADGLVNVQGITSKEVEELAQILNELNELIGDTTNTGGTASAGTVMAKLNKLLTDLTTARAGKIDTIHTNTAKLTDTRMGYIDKLANFGVTGDTGGTASAGTVMAKLNKMLTDWSTARAGYLDTIHGNVGATNNTGGTTSAGTVMAKLNKLLTDWTTIRAGKIDTINSAIGTTGNTGGTATAGTVMAKLNALISASSKGLKVKSVQHGYANKEQKNTKNNTLIYRNITISSINISKSVLFISHNILTYYAGAYHDNVFAISPQLYNATTLRQESIIDYISNDNYSHTFTPFSYYIIEFE